MVNRYSFCGLTYFSSATDFKWHFVLDGCPAIDALFHEPGATREVIFEFGGLFEIFC